MLALAKESAKYFSRQFLVKTMSVLWEKPAAGLWSGLTDNYIKVYTSSDDLTNKLLSVKLVKLFNRDGVWRIPISRGFNLASGG